MDGLGRVQWDNNAVNDSAGTWSVQTVYDFSGRVLEVSNPSTSYGLAYPSLVTDDAGTRRET